MRKNRTMRVWIGAAAVALACGGGLAAQAQPATAPAKAAPTRFPTGLLPLPPEDYARLPKLATFRAWVPRKVDLSPLFPTPGNQYPEPNCTAWATTYSALGFLRGLELGHRPDAASDEPSPAYVYNRLRPPGSSCTLPTFITDALKLLKSEGTVSFADYPDDPSQCETPAPAELMARASVQRLGDWQSIRREQPANWHSPVVIDDIKGALFRRQPVVFAMPAVSDFMSFAGDGIYTHTLPEDSNWHAMTLVGYDEDRQAFRIINSWGTTWGDGGYAWISYDTFKRLVGEAYALENPANPPAGPATPDNLSPRAALDTQIANLPCGVALASESGSHIRLTGFAGDEAALDTLHKAMLAVDVHGKWDMDFHPWPQCEAEMTLATPLHAGGVHLEAETATGAARSGDPVVMQAGETFGFAAETTAARPYLSIIYLQADGTAVALYQGRPDPDGGGHRRVSIGTGGEKQVRFAVGEPFGPEMVIAIASAQPLFGAELATYGTERQFLSGLRARLTTVAPGTVSAAVLRLRTQR